MQTTLNRLPSPFRPMAAPFAELDALARRLGDAFERDAGVLDMRMDVAEEDERFLVTMDIPGVKKSDIDITVAGNVVTVRATSDTRADEASKGRGKKLHTERVFGESIRSFSLPVDIDAERTSASYEHGVLSLTLPKLAGAASHHVRVS